MSKPLTAIAFAALLALAAPFAVAQKAPGDSDGVVAARELLQASGAARQFETVMPVLIAQLQQVFVKMKPGNEKDIKEVFGEIGKRFLDRRQEMFDEVAKLYATKMSAAELREIAAFFKTGIGAKFVAMQPELMQQSMIIGQRWGARIGAEVDADVRRELKKRGIDL